MPVELSRREAREAAAACRGQAFMYRKQAEATGVGETRRILEEAAARMETLAAKFEAHAAGNAPGRHRLAVTSAAEHARL